MGVKIYNEGRVVGYSAYELYVKHSLSEDPNTPPATELEWLSSTIAMGSSMLLKIPTDEISGHHLVDFQLPENTKLAAANTILGSLFLGEAVVDETGWAQKVTSYGPLLTNSTARPTIGQHTAESTEYPTSLSSQLSTTQQKQILNYMKVVDGIVIQPGNWKSTEHTQPIKDMSPVLSERPRVRIFLSDAVKESFYVLLTGFTLRTVLAGVSGLDGSTDTSNNIPEDGAFLGPGIFPWANKIVFSIPSMYATYFLDSKYSRKMSTNGNPSSKESSAKEVHRIPVVDMETTDPATYYSSNFSDSRVPLDVVDLNKINGDAVLTVYQRDVAFPPALFGTKVTATGEQYASPLDTVAPGTVKLFNDTDRDTASAKAVRFQDKIKNNYAFFRDTHDYVLRQINHTVSSNPSNWVELPVADTYVDSLYGALEDSEVLPPFFIQQTNQGDPADYTAVTTMYTRRIRGKVSDQFRADFGIDPATPKGYNFLRLMMLRINRSDTNQTDIEINHSMYDYIKDVPDWKNKYFFIVQGSTTFDGNHVNGLTLVPVAKPSAGDVAPSNTFDYIYKSYGPQFKIPVLLPLSGTESNRSGSYGQYLGGYWNGEGPASHKTILQYLQTVCDITPVALMDYRRKVPEVDGYTDWRDAYSAITVQSFVTAVRNDAVARGVMDVSVTPTQILDGEYTYTYPTPDSSGNYRSITFQKIATQYRSMKLSEVFELAKFYDLSTGEELADGMSLKTHYAKMSSLELTINGNILTRDSAIMLDIDWDDVDSLYELTTSEPEDWATRYKHYFTKSGSSYNKVTGDSAPTWAADTYYKPKYELLNIKYTDSLTLQTSVQKDSPKTISLPWPQDSSQYVFSSGPLAVTNVAGLHQTKALSVANSDGEIYDMSGESGTITDMKDGNIHWDDILNALVNNKAIDVFNTTRFVNEFHEHLESQLVAGDGISIVNDPNDSTKKKISAKFAAGPGISLLDAGNGYIQISNTAMYPGAATGYTRLTRGTHYDVWFGPGDGSSLDGTNSFRSVKNSADIADASEVQSGSKTSSTPYISVDILPMFNADGSLSQCYFRINGAGSNYVLLSSQPSDWSSKWENYYIRNGNFYSGVSGDSAPAWAANTYYERTDYHLGNYNFGSAHFLFHHADDIYTVPKSVIVRVRFKDVEFVKGNNSFNLRDLHSKHFLDTSADSNGIWNIRGMTRGSYSVGCTLENSKPKANSDHKEIVMSAGSIADGFNGQYYNLFSNQNGDIGDAGITDSTSLFTRWINLKMEGTFY